MVAMLEKSQHRSGVLFALWR